MTWRNVVVRLQRGLFLVHGGASGFPGAQVCHTAPPPLLNPPTPPNHGSRD